MNKDYRPCEVTLRDYVGVNSMVENTTKPGIFHEWASSYFYGGAIPIVVGIVEFKDGSVRMVPLSDIRFTDEFARERLLLRGKIKKED